MREIIQVQGLTKTFHLSSKQQKLERTKEKIRVAVDNLSFSACQGEIFGLLGPNGAGKTTTLRMLATLIRPDSGDARVVTDALQELRDQGKTIIVSTHIFSLVEKLCDRVGVIVGGRMVRCDRLERVCGGLSLEDRFFEIYKETAGDEE